MARGSERGVLAAVAFERDLGAVGLPAVELDDEAVRRPVEVDLLALVVDVGEDDVALRLRQTGLTHQLEEPRFELAARELGLAADRSCEGPCPSMPVGPGDDVGDGAVVVELEALG